MSGKKRLARVGIKASELLLSKNIKKKGLIGRSGILNGRRITLWMYEIVQNFPQDRYLSQYPDSHIDNKPQSRVTVMDRLAGHSK